MQTAERSVRIPGEFELEGLLAQGSAEAGLVITHPHPLYGGSMQNNVVAALARAGQELGLTTLRFNFRGVGGSSGRFGDAIGERDDLLAAIDYLLSLGLSRVLIGGYSFGTVVASQTGYGDRPLDKPLWVAPPVGMMEIDPGLVELKPGLIIRGINDAFCPDHAFERLLSGLGPVRVENLRTDHFFGGSEGELIRLAKDFWAG